ncbi:glycosyltransferase family 4 protein [Methylobrevis albus]|uniref:glycosyltransferase family 4 protein n=1 Tax=Methylobrevis albus TaxID=2793297 RepID=UPI002E2B9EB2|nr:glycosyltransferase family 1 protein [Methylobrevis albus]
MLDISRLLRRSMKAAPTGIDRVELAYANHLLHPDRVAGARFLARTDGWSWNVPAPRVARLIEHVAARWAAGHPAEGAAQARRLEAFLGLDPGAFGSVGPVSANAATPSESAALRAALKVLLLGGGPLRAPPPPAGALYVNVSHQGLAAPAHLQRLLARRRLKALYLIHDLIPLTHPEYARAPDEAKHRRRMATVLGTAAAVIANSGYTARVFSDHAAAEGRPVAEVVAAPLGIDATLASSADPVCTPQPYFVTIGTIEPRKNHISLLHVWRHLVERHGPSAPRLVMVGRRGWENENVIDIVERCRTLGNHLIECADLSDQTLVQLMRGSRAVLFPSFVEGYGLPLVEAMSLGVPVIASSIEALEEIGQAVPDFVDPIDGLGWAQAVRDYAAPDSPRRAAQVARIGGFRPPRWDDHFEIFDALVRRLAAVPGTEPAAAFIAEPGRDAGRVGRPFSDRP